MPIKILSVDDEVDLELLLTQYFRRKIRKGEYEFYFAHNGLEALQVILKHPDIDIILSDINMPEMDGLTLLTKINEMRNPVLKCIMVSAYGDMDNIRQAMNNGAFDFATKPIDLDDLQRTIDKAIKQIEFVKQAEKEHSELTDIQDDLHVARDIQHAILPRTFKLNSAHGDSVEIYASMDAAKDVGGDFYDFFPIDEERMGFTIADVSGKGITASIFMAVSRTIIKTVGLSGVKPSVCLTRTNNMLAEESANSMFVTVFYGIYNLKTGQIEFCNAGHNPPYILRANGKVEAVTGDINLVLGALEGLTFSENTITLDQGDALYMYTDGVTEAENETHKLFGEKMLEETLASLKGSTSQVIVEKVREAVRNHAGAAAQSDDVTQLVIRRI